MGTVNCIAHQLSNEWSHIRVLSMESKVRKVCVTQGFILGMKGFRLLNVKISQTFSFSVKESNKTLIRLVP